MDSATIAMRTENAENSVQSRLIRHVPDFVWAIEEKDMVKETPKVSFTCRNITENLLGHYDKRRSPLC